MIVFIGAHVDDIELSCGGLIAKMKGEDIKVISLSYIYHGVGDISGEFQRSMDTLGIRDFSNYSARTRHFHDFIPYIAEIIHEGSKEADAVYTHDITDRHPDHRIVAEQVKRIYKGNLYTFVQPWNGAERPNHYVELTEEHLSKKIQAIGCYKSQAGRAYMDSKYIYAQAIYHGVACGKKYAEAFRIEKTVV